MLERSEPRARHDPGSGLTAWTYMVKGCPSARHGWWEKQRCPILMARELSLTVTLDGAKLISAELSREMWTVYSPTLDSSDGGNQHRVAL
jgi:hypothetical protein